MKCQKQNIHRKGFRGGGADHLFVKLTRDFQPGCKEAREPSHSLPTSPTGAGEVLCLSVPRSLKGEGKKQGTVVLGLSMPLGVGGGIGTLLCFRSFTEFVIDSADYFTLLNWHLLMKLSFSRKFPTSSTLPLQSCVVFWGEGSAGAGFMVLCGMQDPSPAAF